MRSLALVQSLRTARRLPSADRPRRAGARAIALAADRCAAVGAAGGAGNGHRRRAGGAQPVPPHARQRLGHRRGDRGRRLHPTRQTVRPRRRVRSARRNDQRHAGPHGAADGGRARGVERDRARPAHADHPRPRQARGRSGACRVGRGTARRDRAGNRRPRRHRRGVPGVAAHRRDRGRLTSLGVHHARHGAAARRCGRAVRGGGRGERHRADGAGA